MLLLVISRRIGESFLIGDDIEATVVDITGSKVVLGLSAPASVSIKRGEALQTGEFNKAAAVGNINMNSFARMYKKKLAENSTKNKGTP